MNFINIDTLSKNNYNNNLSISSLNKNMSINITSPKEKKRFSDRFNPENIVNAQEKIAKEIDDIHDSICDMCFEMIYDANKLRKLDLIFEIPVSFKGVPVWERNRCIDKLIKLVRKKYMDVTQITDNHLFITWINIKQNMKRNKKKKGKNKK